MKKNFYLLICALFALTFISSCSSNDDDDSTPAVVKVAKIKTIGVVNSDGTETYEFIYNNSDKVSKILDYWQYAGATTKTCDTIKYDYSVVGQLTIKKGTKSTIYEINTASLVTKEYWNVAKTEWASYEYDVNGFIVKSKEYYDGVDHLKMVIKDSLGNITKWTTYNDDGVTVKKYRAFTYSSGDNTSGNHQANITNSNWIAIGGIFGKPSKKLVDSYEYWDAGKTATKGTITYNEFNTDKLPTKITKSFNNGLKDEVFTYTYYPVQ